MRFLYYLSDSMIPLVLILVTGYGLLQKVDIFDAFIEGAVDGFKTVYKILPTLIGLMIAIGIFKGIRYTGVCSIGNRTGDRAASFSFGTCAACDRENVFFFGGDKPSPGCLQTVWA